MIAATLIGVFFTPLFYWAAMTYLGGTKQAKKSAPAASPPHGAAVSAGAHKEHEE
jgi:hypothetical protein